VKHKSTKTISNREWHSILKKILRKAKYGTKKKDIIKSDPIINCNYIKNLLAYSMLATFDKKLNETTLGKV